MLDGGQELDGLVHVVDAVVDEHVGETNEPASTDLHTMPNHRGGQNRGRTTAKRKRQKTRTQGTTKEDEPSEEGHSNAAAHGRPQVTMKADKTERNAWLAKGGGGVAASWAG